MVKVDVAMLTLNPFSYHPGEKLFTRCFLSIIREVPINRFIVVDGGSKRRDLEKLSCLLEKALPSSYTLIIDRGGTRATSRNIAIQLVHTDWLFFLDSDVELKRDAWSTFEPYTLKRNVAAVEGKLENQELQRPFLGCTLIRVEAVKGLKIPRIYHVYEDVWLKRQLEVGGWKWVKTNLPVALHHYKLYRVRDGYYVGLIKAKEEGLKFTLKSTARVFLPTKEPLSFKLAQAVGSFRGVISRILGAR